MCHHDHDLYVVFLRLLRWLSHEGWDRWGCSMHGVDEKCVQNVSGKTEKKWTLGRPGQRLKEEGGRGV
jgi:hypothetical protein